MLLKCISKRYYGNIKNRWQIDLNNIRIKYTAPVNFHFVNFIFTFFFTRHHAEFIAYFKF